MSSSQSLQPAENRQPKRHRLQKTAKDAACDAAKKLLDLLDILSVHLESNEAYTIAFKSDMIELCGFLRVFIQKEGDLTLDPLSPFLRIQFPLPNGPGIILPQCIQAYKDFCICYNKHKNPRPSPSDYAKNWPEEH
ncbi:hypothetical protein HGRIS_010804 [Hohenbuehelia grisea]|uniref:Uncharacterized protein n=1 Tax=Hohenbuehelia grisea TaxID=104357 RepID=A0ABR3IXV2_9AGAR